MLGDFLFSFANLVVKAFLSNLLKQLLVNYFWARWVVLHLFELLVIQKYIHYKSYHGKMSAMFTLTFKFTFKACKVIPNLSCLRVVDHLHIVYTCAHDRNKRRYKRSNNKQQRLVKRLINDFFVCYFVPEATRHRYSVNSTWPNVPFLQWC